MPTMLIDYYKAIEDSSQKMLEAAQSKNWDEVVRYEGACAVLIEQLRFKSQEQELLPEHRREKTRIMQRILRNDAQIRTLAEPWLAQFEHMFEILLLFVVGFLPQELNLLANSLVSFSCAMQVQSFRKVNGYAFASTMCIGNLRGGMDSLCAWLVGGNTKAFGKALHYFAIIFLFALGAGLGSLALAPMGSRAIWLSCLLLFISFCLMFLKEDIEELEEFEHLEHEEALKK